MWSASAAGVFRGAWKAKSKNHQYRILCCDSIALAEVVQKPLVVRGLRGEARGRERRGEASVRRLVIGIVAWRNDALHYVHPRGEISAVIASTLHKHNINAINPFLNPSCHGRVAPIEISIAPIVMKRSIFLRRHIKMQSAQSQI